MLVVGLVGGGALAGEGGGVLVAGAGVVDLVDQSGVVVLDLVVVPGDDPGEGGVRALEGRVGLVQRVPGPVVGQGEQLVDPGGLRGGVQAVRVLAARVGLVDVVAEVHDGVEVLGGQGGVRGPVTVLPVLAVDHAEAEPAGVGAGRRGGAGAAGGAQVAARAEPVPVVAAGLEPADVDVHAVPASGLGDGDAAPDGPAEARVRRDLPGHRDGAGAHGGGVEGVGDQPGPQDDGVRQRVTAGHAEQERVPADGFRVRRTDVERLGAHGDGRADQQAAAADRGGPGPSGGGRRRHRGCLGQRGPERGRGRGRRHGRPPAAVAHR